MEQTSGGEEEEAMEIESFDFGEKIQTSRTRVFTWVFYFLYFLYFFYYFFSFTY